MFVAKPLVIVESPAKARTIAGFLGSDYKVLASMGHVRDLPSKGLSVDTENGFKVDYEVHTSKKNVIKELRDALKDADELYLATDEDREGEAISWHLLEVLKPRVPVKRMVFHEITQHAIADAVANWREVDYGLVDETGARGLVQRLEGASFTVRSVDTKPYTSRPKPPFITSTLQQVGGSRLRMSAQQVMRVAQGLYERGYITYMRTDSTTLSATALSAARQQIEELYGRDYVPPKPRTHASKSKNAQ